MKDLIIPWKHQLLYWALAIAFSSIFLWMDTSITP